MGHPPYSPDLAPNDFSLYPQIKKNCPINDFRHQTPLLECSKTIFGDVSIGVEKQTQMMVVHQNSLSSVMLKNDKLYYGNVRFQLATPEICQETNRSTHVQCLDLKRIVKTFRRIIAIQNVIYWKPLCRMGFMLKKTFFEYYSLACFDYFQKYYFQIFIYKLILFI